MAYNSKYTGAQVEELLDNVSEGGVTLWNTYLFEGSSTGDSVVTIDGKDVTVAANAIVQGTFDSDISAIPTNNLKRIVIYGDVSLTIGSQSVTNSTLEDVMITFSAAFSRDMSYMFGNLRSLRSLRVYGGIPTSDTGVFYYVGANVSDSCVVDINWKRIMLNANFAAYSNIAVLDLRNIKGDLYNTMQQFTSATIGTLDFSGATISGGGSSGINFTSATIGTLDFSGATISGSGSDGINFTSATIGTLDFSGATISSSASGQFIWDFNSSSNIGFATFAGATIYGGENSSGCHFNFRYLTLKSLDLSGTDCSACTSMVNFWFNAKINAVNINGFIVPNGMMSDFEKNMPTSVIGTAVEAV